MKLRSPIPVGALSLVGDDAVISMIRAAAGDELAKLAGCWRLEIGDDEDANVRLVSVLCRRMETVLERLHTLERLAARLSEHAGECWPRGVPLRECPYVTLAIELVAVTRVAARAQFVPRWCVVRRPAATAPDETPRATSRGPAIVLPFPGAAGSSRPAGDPR